MKVSSSDTTCLRDALVYTRGHITPSDLEKFQGRLGFFVVKCGDFRMARAGLGAANCTRTQRIVTRYYTRDETVFEKTRFWYAGPTFCRNEIATTTRHIMHA